MTTTTTTTTYVDVHILQDLPPSNINRDDNGTPKQAVYGGADRLRVSSQAWKRATRQHFVDHMDRAELGVRTRQLKSLFLRELTALGLEEVVAERLAGYTVTELGIAQSANKKADPKKKADQSGYLLFAGRPQVRQIAERLVVDGEGVSKDEMVTILGAPHSLDVALFGRMVADLAKLNVDAAAQVAHAISTHAAPTQFDYFTAVDDEQGGADTGAGMIGVVEFSSATVYRFATIGLHQLLENLGDDPEAAIDGVVRFLDSFVRSMPTGHQTSFAPRTRPALVAVVIRDDQPVNLVSAFEEPVRSRQGVMAQSQKRLADLCLRELERWGDEPILAVASYDVDDDAARAALTAAFGASLPVTQLLDQVRSSLRGRA